MKILLQIMRLPPGTEGRYGRAHHIWMALALTGLGCCIGVLSLLFSATAYVKQVTLEGVRIHQNFQKEARAIIQDTIDQSGLLRQITEAAFQRQDMDEIDRLVQGGVTPLEAVGGVVSPVRGITTRTSTGGAPDTTWRELTTILIVDDVIPSIRQSLRNRFSKTKNTGQTRGAIRSQVIVELESKLRSEIIDSYGDVTVSVYDEDPTVCLVEFSFAVAHGLNQIYLTAHITI